MNLATGWRVGGLWVAFAAAHAAALAGPQESRPSEVRGADLRGAESRPAETLHLRVDPDARAPAVVRLPLADQDIALDGPLVAAVEPGVGVVAQVVGAPGGAAGAGVHRELWLRAIGPWPGDEFDVTLRPSAAEPPASPAGADGSISLTARDGRAIARYWTSPAPLPDGVDPILARSGFLHPIHTPAGLVVTGDSPPAHRHQHGVFFAWTRTRRAGRPVDFWNLAAGQGRVEHAALDGFGVGPVASWLDARLRHVDLTATVDEEAVASAGGMPAGETAIDERWRVVAWEEAGRFVVEVISTQVAASPLEVLEYHYGGFAWRGPDSFTADRVSVRTDVADAGSGRGRAAADGARVRYCAVTGPIDDATATVVILAGPDNPRAPEPIRFHPDEPYFCFAPCRLGSFPMAPGAPRVTRYRIVAADGALDASELDALAAEYAAPTPVRVVR